MNNNLETMEAFFNKRADTYDQHMLIEMQIKLMKSTGFNDVKTVREWESTSIITAKKVKKL